MNKKIKSCFVFGVIAISVLIFTILDSFALFSLCAGFSIGDIYTLHTDSYSVSFIKCGVLLATLIFYISRKNYCHITQKKIFYALFCLFAIHCLSWFMPQFSFDSDTVFGRSMDIFSEVYWYEALQKLWPLGLFVLSCVSTCFIVNKEKENERK